MDSHIHIERGGECKDAEKRNRGWVGWGALSRSLTHFNIPLACVCPKHNLGAPWHSKKKCIIYHLHLASIVTFCIQGNYYPVDFRATCRLIYLSSTDNQFLSATILTQKLAFSILVKSHHQEDMQLLIVIPFIAH